MPFLKTKCQDHIGWKKNKKSRLFPSNWDFSFLFIFFKPVKKMLFFRCFSWLHSFHVTGHRTYGPALCLGLGRTPEESWYDSWLPSSCSTERLRQKLSPFRRAVLRCFRSSCGDAWYKILKRPHEPRVLESIKNLCCSFMSAEFKWVCIWGENVCVKNPLPLAFIIDSAKYKIQ